MPPLKYIGVGIDKAHKCPVFLPLLLVGNVVVRRKETGYSVPMCHISPFSVMPIIVGILLVVPEPESQTVESKEKHGESFSLVPPARQKTTGAGSRQEKHRAEGERSAALAAKFWGTKNPAGNQPCGM